MIALTHMKTDNDVRLAEKVPEIDLILGGHNLVYEKRRSVEGISRISFVRKGQIIERGIWNFTNDKGKIFQTLLQIDLK